MELHGNDHMNPPRCVTWREHKSLMEDFEMDLQILMGIQFPDLVMSLMRVVPNRTMVLFYVCTFWEQMAG